MLKFYIALWSAKLAKLLLRMIKRDATYFPGKLAITICPDFLGKIGKPEKIIGVTGTNGKTTVSNMIEDILKDNGYDILDNGLGANINAGVASTLIEGSTFLGKSKKKIAVLELDERSAKKIYPYIKPNYLICTNLFRDSLKRNAHTEFIANILNSSIPSQTKLILNGDDLIVSNLAPENDRVYFGIDKLETDTDKLENIARDIIVCPKCNSKLIYDYVRYNHIGKAHCPNCDFKSPEINYFVKNIDLENMKMTINENGKEENYKLITNNIINIYNQLAMITVLREFGLSHNEINNSMDKLKIVETRFSEEQIGDKKVILHLAKGQNPIACSRVFDYVRKEKENKVVILLLDDLHDAANSSENISWLYDCDFEFLNGEDIKQIVVAGARYLDDKIRLLIAGIKEEKLICIRDEIETVDYIELQDIDKIFILHDLYAYDLAKKVKEKLRNKIILENNKKGV